MHIDKEKVSYLQEIYEESIAWWSANINEKFGRFILSILAGVAAVTAIEPGIPGMFVVFLTMIIMVCDLEDAKKNQPNNMRYALDKERLNFESRREIDGIERECRKKLVQWRYNLVFLLLMLFFTYNAVFLIFFPNYF